jgi:Amt family ammonium transporter
MFQCAFAIITPALISGSLIGRLKMRSYVLFVFLWVTFCYCPLAHWIWGYNGWLRNLGTSEGVVKGTVDFAGGAVIHLSAGTSALVAAYILGPRVDHKKDVKMSSDNLPFAALGAGVLWFGWIGFNAGSAGAANATASYALANSCAAAASSMLTWTFYDACRGKISFSGAMIAPIAGLACVTPASGYIQPGWALLVGMLAATTCYIGVFYKNKMKVDDTLDVFACHGVGGALGMLLTGLFAEKWIGGVNGAFYGNGIQFWYQLAACMTTIAFSAAVTTIALYLIKFTVGLRASPTAESVGADAKVHGETWLVGDDQTRPVSPRKAGAAVVQSPHGGQVAIVLTAGDIKRDGDTVFWHT